MKDFERINETFTVQGYFLTFVALFWQDSEREEVTGWVEPRKDQSPPGHPVLSAH